MGRSSRNACRAAPRGCSRHERSMTAGWRTALLWGAAALAAAAIAVTFVLWGVNGPAYLVDLFAAYCL